MNALIFGAPGRYIQGPGLLDSSGEHLARVGNRLAVITDSAVWKIAGERLVASCRRANVEVQWLRFDGEVTHAALVALRAEASVHRIDGLIGMGGGKCIDAGKAMAHTFGLPLVTIPTVASNDAPCSKNYVIYDENHRLSEVGHLPRSAAYVLVDTQLLAQAPRSFLIAGIADALTKRFEAEQCQKADGINMFGARPALSALALARCCYDILREDAAAALSVAGSGTPDAAFERVIEAVILMSGLGFESGGLSLAHAMTRGLSAIANANSQPHGLQVAYGLMVQLTAENRSEAFIADLRAFYAQLGLPVRLADLGVNAVTPELLEQIVAPTLGAPHARNFSPALNSTNLTEAMQCLENT